MYGSRLAGRTAVIVGVGSPIGRACAKAFAAEGAELLLVDPSAAVADQVSAEVVQQVPSAACEAFEAAYSGDDAVAAVAAVCDERWGRLDVLLNVTALLDYWDGGPSAAGWEEVVRANLLGPVAYTLGLRPLLERSIAGAVVYLSSIDGLLGNPDFPAYSVSKGGLIPLTHVMAHDLGPAGVRVNCIAMAGLVPVGTGPQPTVRPGSLPNTVLRTPLGRVPAPEELASVAVFLASPEASYVSGTVLPVDGGRIGVTPGTGFSGGPATGE
jgi:NAD(P)-dependent dehydrogenase (short-subunit alcohol dehydrogenase family)